MIKFILLLYILKANGMTVPPAVEVLSWVLTFLQWSAAFLKAVIVDGRGSDHE